MEGWALTGKETLEMREVNDIECPLHGSIPAPRVLQNQLDRNLESCIVTTERILLKSIQRELRKWRPDGRDIVSAAVICIFNVLERDTWRLMYWRKRPGVVSRPPSGQVQHTLMVISGTDGAILLNRRHSSKRTSTSPTYY